MTQSLHMSVQSRYLIAAAVALAASLVGCSKPVEPTAGEKLDSAVASTGAAVDKMADKAGAAIDGAGAKVDDAAITVAVNTELAKDPGLSALSINVDTSGGRVQLKGSAPDSAARERASQLAAAVSGVRSVDNQLLVKN